MYGMDWPTAVVIFSMFGLAGWAMWLSVERPACHGDGLVEEIADELGEMANHCETWRDSQRLADYAHDLREREPCCGP